ncbi:MAG: potassium channel protein [Kofleriaceae bacterium]|nr:potassium channel protein [Kofleriaceae bacterium]MCL4228717.1 TrkA family potassium uptake protein [Myxococcales bacterium]
MDSSFRNRLVVGLVAMTVVILGGATGYWLLGDGRWGWFDCLYMTVITVTTVGYGETLPGIDEMGSARTFTMVLLVFGTGTLVYFASTITAFIVEGELKHVLAAQRLRKRIDRMKDHFVVCGAGTTGRHIVKELVATGRPVLAVDLDEGRLKELLADHPRAELAYVVGDATTDDVLEQCHLDDARGLAAALASDKDNLFLVVATRQMNPRCRIIARVAEVDHAERLRRAGADSVVSPNFIGGMRIVSELVRPSVVRFLDQMLRDKQAAMRIEEVTVGDGSPLAGKRLGELAIHRRFGMNVLAVKRGEAWTYNPGDDHVLEAPTVVVVLGTTEQVKELRVAAT